MVNKIRVLAVVALLSFLFVYSCWGHSNRSMNTADTESMKAAVIRDRCSPELTAIHALYVSDDFLGEE